MGALTALFPLGATAKGSGLFELRLLFPGSPCSDGKESPRQCRRPGFNPWSGRPPGEGNGNPLRYSCLENSMDRGAWQAAVRRITKSQTGLSDEHVTSLFLHLFGQGGSNKRMNVKVLRDQTWVLHPCRVKPVNGHQVVLKENAAAFIAGAKQQVQAASAQKAQHPGGFQGKVFKTRMREGVVGCVLSHGHSSDWLVVRPSGVNIINFWFRLVWGHRFVDSNQLTSSARWVSFRVYKAAQRTLLRVLSISKN